MEGGLSLFSYHQTWYSSHDKYIVQRFQCLGSDFTLILYLSTGIRRIHGNYFLRFGFQSQESAGFGFYGFWIRITLIDI